MTNVNDLTTAPRSRENKAELKIKQPHHHSQIMLPVTKQQTMPERYRRKFRQRLVWEYCQLSSSATQLVNMYAIRRYVRQWRRQREMLIYEMAEQAAQGASMFLAMGWKSSLLVLPQPEAQAVGEPSTSPMPA